MRSRVACTSTSGPRKAESGRSPPLKAGTAASPVHPRKVHLQAIQAGRAASKRQQPGIGMGFQIQPDRQNIAANLLGAFFQQEDHATLAAFACGIDEVAGDRGLAGACHPRTTRSRIRDTIPPLRQHGVEAGYTGGYQVVRPPDARSPTEVTGNTLMPSTSIRKGYSFVPCAETAVH